MAWFLPIWRFRALGFSGFLGPMLFFKSSGQANFHLEAAQMVDFSLGRTVFSLQQPAARYFYPKTTF